MLNAVLFLKCISGNYDRRLMKKTPFTSGLNYTICIPVADSDDVCNKCSDTGRLSYRVDAYET